MKYPRDLSTMYKQYKHLREHIGKKEYERFIYHYANHTVVDKAKIDDLDSYINYEFIKLVQEYDPTSPVDFPGYIKSKLTLRTKHSYLKSYFKHMYRESLTSTGAFSKEYENLPVPESSTELPPELYSKLTDKSLNALDRFIIECWSEGLTNKQIYAIARSKGLFKQSRGKFSSCMDNLKQTLRSTLKESNISYKKEPKTTDRDVLVRKALASQPVNTVAYKFALKYAKQAKYKTPAENEYYAKSKAIEKLKKYHIAVPKDIAKIAKQALSDSQSYR